MPDMTFTLVGGPTITFALGGLTFMTDPTFDEPRSYPAPGEPPIVKTSGPALAISDLPHPDVILLSHDHHADNLDESGRDLTSRVAKVFTTTVGAERLGNGAIGLDAGESATLALPAGGELTITGVPAHHGPEGLWQRIGPVIGFVLTGDGLPTIYVSGDNSSLELVRKIKADVGRIDVAVLFAGAAKFDQIMDGAFLTMTNDDVLEAATILDGATIIPVHADGWAHFSQNTDQLQDAFDAAGLGNRIIVMKPGTSVKLSV